MSTRTPGPDLPVRRIDRVLAFMALGLTVVSIICFVALMIGAAVGGVDLGQGIWPLVAYFPAFALPVAFLMILTLLIMSFVRRSRLNKGA